jgi:hypothetical protein
MTSPTTPWNENVPRDINNKQSFQALPPKQNNQRKNTVAHDQSQPIQQSAVMNRPVEFTGTRYFSQIDGDTHPTFHLLGTSWIPKTTTFIQKPRY